MMSRDDSAPLTGFWALGVAIFGWLAPMGVYFVLRMQLHQDAIWPTAGPYLLVAFGILAALAQVGALFMAAIAWPAKGARWTVVVALVLLAWNATLLVEAMKNLK